MEKRTHSQQVAEAEYSAAVSALFHCKTGDVRRRNELLRQLARAATMMHRAYGASAEQRMQAIYASNTREVAA